VSEVAVAFVDVGQGDCTIAVDRPSGEALLIDCPPEGHREAIAALKANGAVRLRVVFATHQHLDHLGSVPTVVKDFPTEELRMNPATHVPADPVEAKKLRAALVEIEGLPRIGVRLQHAEAGDSGEVGDLAWEILAPDRAQLFHAQAVSEANHASVVMKLSVSGYRILVGADADAESWEAMLLRGADLSANALRVPHHGGEMTGGSVSLTSVLDAVGASVNVISVGSRNSYGHPGAGTLGALRASASTVFCTQLNSMCAARAVGANTACAGTVTVLIKSASVQITPDAAAHRRAVSALPAAQCI
jgi:competence protein ComEC